MSSGSGVRTRSGDRKSGKKSVSSGETDPRPKELLPCFVKVTRMEEDKVRSRWLDKRTGEWIDILSGVSQKVWKYPGILYGKKVTLSRIWWGFVTFSGFITPSRVLGFLISGGGGLIGGDPIRGKESGKDGY